MDKIDFNMTIYEKKKCKMVIMAQRFNFELY